MYVTEFANAADAVSNPYGFAVARFADGVRQEKNDE